MAEYFNNVQKIKYEGPKSKNMFAFKYYNPDEVVMGKTMREHLKFAMSWWHTLCAEGADMFGRGTSDKSFGTNGDPIEHAKAKIDVGFELMDKLGIDYFCFHDVDLVDEADTLAESNKRMDIVSDYILEKMNQTGKKCLWGTTNAFSHPRFMHGAGTSPDADVFAYAAAKIKKSIEVTVKLGGTGYVFWGGREGYETLLNTDMKFELDNMARLMKMAVEYARKIGFKGDFYIEPKPKEPTKNQYDFDAATACMFLRNYGLDKDFKLNIEANHATLAGHTFQHELRVSAINGMFGSVDANQGDMLLGWDTDQFPTNVYDAVLAMYEIIKAGGFTNGGLNFDAKVRRGSYTLEDIVYGYIAGMDTFALGLRKAAAIIEDGRIDEFVENRYKSYKSGIGAKIVNGEVGLEELCEYSLKKEPELPQSGRQEYLETILNNIMFDC